MATTANIKFNGIHKEDFMYIGDMPFDKVCRVVERMIATNKLVQNAERTELRHTEEINTPTRYSLRRKMYYVVLDGETLARVTVKEMK